MTILALLLSLKLLKIHIAVSDVCNYSPSCLDVLTFLYLLACSRNVCKLNALFMFYLCKIGVTGHYQVLRQHCQNKVENSQPHSAPAHGY